LIYLQTPAVSQTPGVSAAADLTQAIQLAQTDHDKDPSDWANHFNLALYHLAAAHHPEATSLYQTGLDRAPAWAKLMAHRDLLDYLNLFPEDEAAKEWRDRLETTTRSPENC
jgi:thioredoxin-like negative regulator of GroEL